MRRLDYFLRSWRYWIVKPNIPAGSRVVDIGGFDGSFLLSIRSRIEKGVCIDPLIEEMREGNLEYINTCVMGKIPLPDSSFDLVTMLAVYEHLDDSRAAVTAEVYRILKDGGCAVLTVPGNAVDPILKVLRKLRLIDGMSLEEHNHFDCDETIKIFKEKGFRLMKRTRFQMGLNNLFIFRKERG